MKFQLLISCVLALAGHASASSLKNELCEQVAPGSHYHVHSGEDCTVSCHIGFLGVVKAQLEADTSCKHGWGRCVLGECRALDYEPPNGLDSYTIRIKEARVESADEITATPSDPFVVVTLVGGSSASFSAGTKLCRTPTVWDKPIAKWNFSCRQVELESSAVLKFTVHDMDTLRTDPLGDVTTKLSDLLRDGESELWLENGYRGSSSQTLIVEVLERPSRLPQGCSSAHSEDD